MPALDYAQPALRIELGLYRAVFLGKLGLGKDEVYPAQRHQVGINIVRRGLYHRCKLGKYAFDLRLLLYHKLFEFVSKLHHCRRFDKKGLAAAGLVMYKPRDIGSVFLLDRDDEPAVPDGYDGILKVFGQRGGTDNAVELFTNTLVGNALIAAYPCKCRRCAVEKLIL